MVWKQAEMQFSCTCLQYDVDRDRFDAVLEAARGYGFEVKQDRDGYVLKRAIEAELEAEAESLNYSSEEDNYRVPEDVERAIDCLRLSYIAADYSSGTVMPWGEPASSLAVAHDWSLRDDRYPVDWLFIDVTERCNITCDFCYRKSTGGRDMPADQFKALVEGFERAHRRSEEPAWKRRKVGITMGGGEPTVRSELPELLKIARPHADYLTLSTNGTNPLEGCRGLLDGIAVSVPFIYSRELSEEHKMSMTEQRDRAARAKGVAPRLCLSAIMTSKTAPGHVQKMDGIAAELGATDVLWLLWKPVGKARTDLFPSKQQARRLLEEIVRSAWNSELNYSIDVCMAVYTTPTSCYGNAWVARIGEEPVRMNREACAFGGCVADADRSRSG